MFDLFDLMSGAIKDTAELLTTLLSCIPLALFAALYVLQGIALTLLRGAAHKGSVWMAWVPFANQYLLGQMADVYTDDRVLRGEVSPDYAPSTLRRKMLGFSIVSSIFSGIAGTAMLVAFFAGFAGLFTGFLGGWFDDSEAVENAEQMLGVFVVGFLIFIVTTAIYVLFQILYLVSSCKAHYRLFFMLDAPVPALWSADDQPPARRLATSVTAAPRTRTEPRI